MAEDILGKGENATLVSGRVPVDGSGVTQPVSIDAASPTAFADTTTVANTKLRGLSIANTSTSSRAQIRLRNTNVSGTILVSVTLAPGESVDYTYPAGRTVPSGTLYMQLVSGTVEGAVYTS